MASTIAAAAAAPRRCPTKIAPYSVLLPSCKSDSSASVQVPASPCVYSWGSKQSLFLLGHSRSDTLLSSAQPPGRAGARVVQAVDCQQRQGNPGLGSKAEPGVQHSSKKESWDGSNALAVTEGVCIVVAGASYTTSVIRSKRQATASVASSSASVNELFSKFGDFSTWHLPALWAALVVNAIFRSMQWQSSTKTSRKWEEESIKDFTLDQRMGKLEEEVQSVGTVARMLSRHLEKLGVRFRVTRRTLRDPIQETALLAQKTSEVVTALASREDMLEAELLETQRALVAMQAQQAKQLDLLVAAVKKTLKSQKDYEERVSKELARHIAGSSKSTNGDTSNTSMNKRQEGSVPLPIGTQNLVQKQGDMRKGFMGKETPNKAKALNSKTAKVSENATVKTEKGPTSNSKNGQTGSAPDSSKSQTRNPGYKPDTSFTKEDFWSSTPSSAADVSVEHEVVDYLTSTERTTDALAKDSESSLSGSFSGKLDSFFSGRKSSNSAQGSTNLPNHDYHDPDFSSFHSQSRGSGGGSGRHRDYHMGFNLPNNVQAKEVPPEVGGGNIHNDNRTWYNANIGDGSSGSGSPRIGDGMLNCFQAGFVDTDIFREFKDGYASN